MNRRLRQSMRLIGLPRVSGSNPRNECDRPGRRDLRAYRRIRQNVPMRVPDAGPGLTCPPVLDSAHAHRNALLLSMTFFVVTAPTGDAKGATESR